MNTPLGTLTAAGEMFVHQTTETFANVATSDPAWTERAYGCAIAKDGVFALHWGIGKYTNLNVLDGFAGVAVGPRQRNVRFSRALNVAPVDTAVGPFRYEVLDPLKTARISLEATQHQPIAFEILQHRLEAPWLEDRSYVQRAFRRVQDEVRYVVPTTTTGWVEVAGQRWSLEAGGTFGFRDHSWGIKQNTGPASPETPDRAIMPKGLQYRMLWCPSVLEREDGGTYRVHLFTWESRTSRGLQLVNESRVFQPDGSSTHAHETTLDLRFDPANILALDNELIAIVERTGMDADQNLT